MLGVFTAFRDAYFPHAWGDLKIGLRYVGTCLLYTSQGKIQGVVDSLVVLSADSQGIMRGIVQQGEKFWILAGGAEAGGPITGLASREIKQSGLSDVVARFQEDSKLNNDIILPPHQTRRSGFNAEPLAAGQLFDVCLLYTSRCV